MVVLSGTPGFAAHWKFPQTVGLYPSTQSRSAATRCHRSPQLAISSPTTNYIVQVLHHGVDHLASVAEPCPNPLSIGRANLRALYTPVRWPTIQYVTTGVDAERTHLERLEGRSQGSSAMHPCQAHPETRYICPSATVPLSMLHLQQFGTSANATGAANSRVEASATERSHGWMRLMCTCSGAHK